MRAFDYKLEIEFKNLLGVCAHPLGRPMELLANSLIRSKKIFGHPKAVRCPTTTKCSMLYDYFEVHSAQSCVEW